LKFWLGAVTEVLSITRVLLLAALPEPDGVPELEQAAIARARVPAAARLFRTACCIA
jgi:hypothetical protein